MKFQKLHYKVFLFAFNRNREQHWSSADHWRQRAKIIWWNGDENIFHTKPTMLFIERSITSEDSNNTTALIIVMLPCRSLQFILRTYLLRPKLKDNKIRQKIKQTFLMPSKQLRYMHFMLSYRSTVVVLLSGLATRCCPLLPLRIHS